MKRKGKLYLQWGYWNNEASGTDNQLQVQVRRRRSVYQRPKRLRSCLEALPSLHQTPF